MNVFGMWEKAEVPRQNPRKRLGQHANLTQVGQSLDSNPQPQNYEAAMLTTHQSFPAKTYLYYFSD